MLAAENYSRVEEKEYSTRASSLPTGSAGRRAFETAINQVEDEDELRRASASAAMVMNLCSGINGPVKSFTNAE